MANLNIFQQVFCLSLKVCSVASFKGTAEALETKLTSNLNDMLANKSNFDESNDEWSIVWGPTVWQSPYSNTADQAVVVTCNATTKTYVVSIAATNPTSPFDVMFEDAAVSPVYMQNIPGGMVSIGNYVGLQVLLNSTSGNQTLEQFLTQNASPSATLIFAGHSLGGGLTPLLAYSLYPNGTTGSGWGNVYTYPTAGPATTNQAFATAYNAAYRVTSGSGYQIWNANQYNTRDIVPNAWSNANSAPSLQYINAAPLIDSHDKMFFTDVKMAATVVVLREFAQALAAAGTTENPYVAVNNNALFAGTRFNGMITNNTELESEILHQHIQAYIEKFSVGSLFDQSVVDTIQPPLVHLIPSLAATRLASENEEMVELA
jgi:hypothetical protein